MPLLQAKEQTKTLHRFYSEMADSGNSPDAEIGTGMMLFVDLVSQTFNETTLYGLTHGKHLIIKAKDTDDAEWFVSVGCTATGEYYFEYEMPATKRPWPYASVRGMAQNWTEARKYLI